MNSVELLEHAAKVLRERALIVTGDPWVVDVDRDGAVRIPDIEQWRGMTNPVFFGEDRPTADYVALMHPPVALALADWLEATAAELGGPLPSYLDDVDKAAVAVAIAILRKEQT